MNIILCLIHCSGLLDFPHHVLVHLENDNISDCHPGLEREQETDLVYEQVLLCVAVVSSDYYYECCCQNVYCLAFIKCGDTQPVFLRKNKCLLSCVIFSLFSFLAFLVFGVILGGDICWV